jgi:hypothetical protein
MDQSAMYVYVGAVSELNGKPYVLGSEISLTTDELRALDAGRTHFVSKAQFDELFGAEDAVFLSPNFIGVWPPTFVEKVEAARDIVRKRRQGV